MVAHHREVAVHASLERLRSACPAIWIGGEVAVAARPDERAPTVEPVLPGIWSIRGRFIADVGGERRLTVVPAETGR